jgi:uncharacterized protein (DUF2236 family)
MAAHVVIANNDIDQLAPVLPADMIQYLRTLSGELPLDQANQFYAQYVQVTQAVAALTDQEADADIADQYLGAYQQLLLMHDQAMETLNTALAAAVDAPDPEWRQYLSTMLTDTQEQVATLGRRVEEMIEYFTAQQDARAELDNWLNEGNDGHNDMDDVD